MLQIIENNPQAFFDVPFNVYQPADNYVSPMQPDIFRMLDGSKNPLFSCGNPYKYWVVLEDKRPVGRIIANVHRQSNEIHKTKRAQFGFFDCKNDEGVAKLLLDAALEFARDEGMDELAGNFNLTAMQQAGVVTSGFGVEAYTDMVVNPQHIPQLLEANGFTRFFPMTTFELAVEDARLPPPDYAEMAARGFRFAPIRKDNFHLRMEEARLILNDGFRNNPMFVPLTSEEFMFQAQDMMTILDPKLSAIVHHNDNPVGCIIAIPDLNGLMKAAKSRYDIMTPFHFLNYRLNRNRAVMIFYSVSQEYHKMGINPAMLGHVVKAMREGGYKKMGGTWISDENPASLRQVEKIGATKLQGLHLFRKAVSA